MRTPVSLGVVGLDDWGLSIARTLGELPRADLRWLCGTAADVPVRRRTFPPAARLTDRIEDVLADEMLDALVVSVPLDSRADLVRLALYAGKHVLAPSPLTNDGEEADELAGLAEQLNLRLLAGSELVFEPALQLLKDLLAVGGLGDVNYLYTGRHDGRELGTDALWEVAAIDVPVLLELLADEPVEVSCRGESYVGNSKADVVFCHLRFASGICAHLHASSLELRTAARLTVVGSRRVAVFDQADFEHRLTLHEQARRGPTPAVHSQLYDDHALGGWSDARHRLCETFLSTIRTPVERASARQGASVANVLHALARSLESGATQPVRERPADRVAEITTLNEEQGWDGPGPSWSLGQGRPSPEAHV